MSALAEAVAALLVWVPVPSSRSRDRRLLGQGRARCGVRSVEGRVLDIGPEWSAGVCRISTGLIQFEPTIGVAGDRRIEVLEVLSSDIDADEDVNLGRGQSVTYLIRTADGDLYWALPEYVAEEVAALLSSPPR